MKINNKDLIQSYIITSAKYDYNVYEKRILYRLIEMFQQYTKGEKLKEKIFIQSDLFNVRLITMPITMFLNGEEDKNHARIKQAIESLENKKFIYEDDSTWEIIRILSEPKIDKYKESVSFRINPKIVDAFLDFSKGFSKYEFATAMQFESIYAMRFYELLSGQKKPIIYSIDNLKIMFNLEDKYNKINDFIKRVIIPAKKELDKSSPYSFNYNPIKTGRKITAIRFLPVYQPHNRDMAVEAKKLKAKSSIRWELDVITINYLKENYIFSDDEIKRNLDLFVNAQNSNKFDLLYFLSEQRLNAQKKVNPKGWIINAIKKQLELHQK